MLNFIFFDEKKRGLQKLTECRLTEPHLTGELVADGPADEYRLNIDSENLTQTFN